MKIYIEKEQIKQGKIQNIEVEEKSGTRKCNGLTAVFKEINRLKDSLIMNVIKGLVTSGQAQLNL